MCSVCRQIELKQSAVDWSAKGADFEALVERVRGKHEYDCIVPFSGGKDSTFTLWHLVAKLGLDPKAAEFYAEAIESFGLQPYVGKDGDWAPWVVSGCGEAEREGCVERYAAAYAEMLQQ